MQTYPNISKSEIERQYFLRGLRPDYDVAVVPDWLSRSSEFSQRFTGKIDLVYGNQERNYLDFYSADVAGCPLMIYIHGGYWQRGDKSVYRFLAEGFLEQGISVALINYPMCPAVRLSEISAHARKAVHWLWCHSEELAFSRDNIHIVGHSAGGHLTAEMMMTDWSSVEPEMPQDCILSGTALSGLYDLEPLLFCSENARLKLDPAEVKIASPLWRQIRSLPSMIVGYGANEPPDMQRQSIEFFETFRGISENMSIYIASDADHFDVVNVLGDFQSPLFSQIIGLIKQRS
ncbi:MAG: alpha/beta hydrolase [Acidiferrobacterales bacterium]|nr:alpha/beta hydrolase [Acidiferrobacterales bacterium]